MKRLLLSTAIIGTVFSTAFLLSRAYFSDTQTSSNNLFTAGTIDLKIGNDSYYNGLRCAFSENPEPGYYWQGDPNTPGFDSHMIDLIGTACSTSWQSDDLGEGNLFFDFQDLKPGDWGEDTISITVQDNDSWACMEMNISSQMAANDQALANTVQFVWWADDGNNVLEQDEYASLRFAQGSANEVLNASYALSDSQTNIWDNSEPGLPMVGAKTYYIAKAWCFGDMGFDPQDPANRATNNPQIHPGITCSGDLVSNDAQNGTFSVDVFFSAIQARNNADYVCPGPISCQQTPAYAAATDQSNFLQGLRKNDTPVLDERSDPNKALNSPEGIVTQPSFVSLGFGGSIIVSFAGPVGNGAGGDLTIHEITNGRNSYPKELATVEVSQNGTTWFNIGTASSKDPNGTVVLDIDNGAPHLAWIQYVRLTDISNEDPFEPTADGYDLDAVEAIYGLCQ